MQKELDLPNSHKSICVINALIVFVYSILFSSLTIYLTKALGFSAIEAENTASLFLALNFILHLLAGYIGGRFLPNRQILLLSVITQLLGILVIVNASRSDIFLGLSMVVIGCGLNTTSLQCILTSKFKQNDDGREKAFFWMYSILNAGFLVGFSTAGYFDLSNSFGSLYMVSAWVTLLSIVWIAISWRRLSDNNDGQNNISNKAVRRGVGYLFFIALVPICDLAFRYPEISNEIVLGIGLTALLSILFVAKNAQVKQAKNGLLAFFVLTFFSIVFWALFYIGPLGGILFLENNIDLNVLGYDIAPQWLMNLNAIFIITGAPLLSKLITKLRGQGYKITTPRQFFASLLLIAFSYFVYSAGIYFSDPSGKTSMIWVIFHYLFQASGELLIAPVGYAMVGQLIPSRQQGYMMGVWMMVSGIAVELSNIFSHYMSASVGAGQIATNHQYLSVFNKLGVSTCLLAIGLFLSLRFLERLVASVSSNDDVDASDSGTESNEIYA